MYSGRIRKTNTSPGILFCAVLSSRYLPRSNLGKVLLSHFFSIGKTQLNPSHLLHHTHTPSLWSHPKKREKILTQSLTHTHTHQHCQVEKFQTPTPFPIPHHQRKTHTRDPPRSISPLPCPSPSLFSKPASLQLGTYLSQSPSQSLSSPRFPGLT